MSLTDIIPERKALIDLMNEVIALQRKTPNCTRKVNNAFDTIYWHIDSELGKLPASPTKLNNIKNI